MSPARRILVLLAHPALETSRVNAALAQAARRVAGVTVHDLYERYPDFDVRVPREQSLLREHDLVVAQHPLLWYSIPSLLKEWLDLVLEHGWAYGRGGTALCGKRWLAAVTTGGSAAGYARGALHGYTMDEFLRPLEQTARLCGMEWLPPFIVHGTHLLDDAAIARQGRAYARHLADLRDGAPGPDPGAA